MNREEIIMILGTIKVAYPKFYSNFNKEDIKRTIDLWLEMFKDDDKQYITRAVKELMCELEFPPCIADIKKKINKYSLEDAKKEEITAPPNWNDYPYDTRVRVLDLEDTTYWADLPVIMPVGEVRNKPRYRIIELE